MTTKVTGSVLADTAVSAGTYGGTQTLQAFTVDAQGRITYAANITSGVITAGTRGQGSEIIVPTIQYNALGQIIAATNTTIRTATTSVTGVVQLADSVSNTSTTAAATASAVKAAYDAAGANASTALTSAQANTGAGLISTKSAYEANVGAGLISTKSAYEANVGAGLISTKSAYEANVGIEVAARQANVGAAAISSTSASNLSSGTVPSARLSGSYTGITGVGTLTTGSIPGSLISSAVSNATAATYAAVRAYSAVSATGTYIPFFGIPSGTKRITLVIDRLSNTLGSSNLKLLLGWNSTFETTGYSGYAWTVNNPATTTSGALLTGTNSASSLWSGIITIASVVGGYTWAISGVLAAPGVNAPSMCGWSKTTSGTLDCISLTTNDGTDTFDSGTVNILYE